MRTMRKAFFVLTIALAIVIGLMSATASAQEGEELPAGLVEFCEEHPTASVRERATGEVFDCDEVLSPFEAVEEPFEVLDEEMENGEWQIEFFDGATDQMRAWFDQLQSPTPGLWPSFPNVDNPEVNFVAANGLEYGLDESVFMEQNEPGNFPVQARGYRLITGDYDIPEIDACSAETDEAGCAIAIFNVGEVTADLEGRVRQGFTVPGRYWNGDELDQAMWGLSSHVSANMLNYATTGAGDDTLNQSDRTNAGANCSVPGACDRVRFVIAVTSGNQLLVKAITFVERTQ